MQLTEAQNLETEDAAPKPDRPVGTVTVLAALVAAAGAFSYLGAFAFTDALARANVIAPIASRHPDPRFKWMGITFAALLSVFLAVAGLMRSASLRQFRQIDQMGEDA